MNNDRKKPTSSNHAIQSKLSPPIDNKPHIPVLKKPADQKQKNTHGKPRHNPLDELGTNFGEGDNLQPVVSRREQERELHKIEKMAEMTREIILMAKSLDPNAEFSLDPRTLTLSVKIHEPPLNPNLTQQSDSQATTQRSNSESEDHSEPTSPESSPASSPRR